MFVVAISQRQCHFLTKMKIAIRIVILLIIEVQGLNQVCYGKYGCFSDGGPFHGIFTPLPTSPSGVGTTYRLFTRRTPGALLKGELLDDANTTKLKSSTFNEQSLIKIIVHGFIEPEFGINDWMLAMKDELLVNDNFNVVLVSWTNGNQFPYIQAAANTRMVGAMVAEFVLFLTNTTATTCNQVHIIGFSLGAHISGYAGKRSLKTGCMFGRITGLDPAGPLFESRSPAMRLHRYDARFVDVIHTDTRITSLGIVGSFGLTHPVGHADFYPNGGYHQPGCRAFTLDLNIIDSLKDLVVCSHKRAVEYFTESINDKCQMRSYPCTSPRLFDHGKCATCQQAECQFMGFRARKPASIPPIQYYLKTHPATSFCGYHYKITIYTGDAFLGGLDSEVYITLTGKHDSEKDVKLERRYHRRGSSQSFILLAKNNLGGLIRMQIWHKKTALWYLDRVTVRVTWLTSEYTACFRSWFHPFSSSKEAMLLKGIKKCTY